MPETTLKLIWYVLFLPLAGSLFQALFGKAIMDRMGPVKGKRLLGYLAVLPIAGAFLIGAAMTYQLAGEAADLRSHVVVLYDWITINGLSIPFEVRVDPLSMTMVLIVTGVGALIHLYATGYMAEDREYSRFFTYLNLFIACMLSLVLANNLVLMFVGWEGVGACSYLLIGFWHQNIENAKAANKAFIMNRIGDWGFTLALFLIVAATAGYYSATNQPANPGFLSFDNVFTGLKAIYVDQPGLATAIALLLFVGACGKSAQFPLYNWLPDAMAGPTPVSALIHAATMVTAGVFLLNRMHLVFEMSPVASAVVACIGAFTATFAALIAFGQTDIKKVLAYSTVSQLGFMFIGCGVGAYWTGMFHVTTHAFFKALLFLGSGAVIYAMAHNQDMRNYGGLRKYLPITFLTMAIGWLAIAGFPYLSGFYSKEAILGGALASDHAKWVGYNLGYTAGWVGLAAAALTAWYMTRLTGLTFFGTPRWLAIPVAEHSEHGDAHGHDVAHDPHAHAVHHAAHSDEDHGDPHGFFFTAEQVEARAAAEPHEHHHDLDANHVPKEVPPSMWVPLVVLAILSVVGGWVLSQGEMFKDWLYPQGLTLINDKVHEHPHEIPLMALSIGAAAFGLIVGAIMYFRGLPKSEGWDLSKWSPLRRSAADQFGYDRSLTEAAVDGGGVLANFAWKSMDAGFIDGIVNGSAKVVGFLGNVLRMFQTGVVRVYALMMLLGVVGILGYFAYVLMQTGGTK